MFRQYQFSRPYIHLLSPQSTLLYAWEAPSETRALEWKCGRSSRIDDLLTSNIGTFKDSRKKDIFWVTFLDGMQRVLLFTEDEVLASMANLAGIMNRFKMDVLLELHGIGLSIVNNFEKKEIIYVNICSTNIIWEGFKEGEKHYKTISPKTSKLLEEGYQRYILQGEESDLEPQELPEGKLEVDWETYEMFKPHKKLIRRRFRPGVWVQFKSSDSQTQLHAKINNIQIDNQLPDSIFRTVFAPVPPPRSVISDSLGRPFMEVSLLMKKAEHSTVVQYNYVKVLVQEFHVKVDKGLIIALTAMFSSEHDIVITKMSAIERDENMLKEELKNLMVVASAKLQRNWFDYIHFSPMKVHISFSNTGEGGSQQGMELTSNVASVLLQSVGITLTEVQDVVFRFSFFERRQQLINSQQLISEAMWHYGGQAMSQLHVLIFGLDVIGNPFGFVVGITEGIGDLFYEPYLGAIQGPEEFAEGLLLGLRSLVGHTVEGAAGAVQRISATLGKGLAALTFDKEFQKKRRQMRKRPVKLTHGMARHVRGVGMSVVEGVTGVFTQPIAGATQEGMGGFFKGVGKGVIGLVIKPTSGVVDFTSATLDAVRRAAKVNVDEVRSLRLPRFIRSDGVVRPYLKFEAEGANLLLEVDRGRFATTDHYAFHAVLGRRGKRVLLATDRRLLYLIKSSFLGLWKVEWQFMYDELPEPLFLTSHGLAVVPEAKGGKILGCFERSRIKKVVPISNPEAAEVIIQKIEEMKRSA